MCYVFDDILNSYFSLFKSINSEAIKVFPVVKWKKFEQKNCCSGKSPKSRNEENWRIYLQTKRKDLAKLEEKSEKVSNKRFPFLSNVFSHMCSIRFCVTQSKSFGYLNWLPKLEFWALLSQILVKRSHKGNF
jgi:hypothetical protein